MQNRLVAATNGLGEWMGVAVKRTLENRYKGILCWLYKYFGCGSGYTCDKIV